MGSKFSRLLVSALAEGTSCLITTRLGIMLRLSCPSAPLGRLRFSDSPTSTPSLRSGDYRSSNLSRLSSSSRSTPSDVAPRSTDLPPRLKLASLIFMTSATCIGDFSSRPVRPVNSTGTQHAMVRPLCSTSLVEMISSSVYDSPGE